MLPRTDILVVPPRRMTDPQRESLVSLVIRTAQANGVSPAKFISDKIANAETLPGLRSCIRAIGVSTGQTINGSSGISEKIAHRMEVLTHLKNLRACTTLAFAPFATINGLLRKDLAWSSGFLEKEKTPYYPLLWALEPVRVCTESKQVLRSLCPKCREPLKVLSGNSVISRCQRCRTDLRSCSGGPSKIDPLAQSVKDMQYELWLAEELGEFICTQSTSPLPGDFSFRSTLCFWLKTFQISSDLDSATKLGVSHASLYNWINNAVVPRLRVTMSLCWTFGLTLNEFLNQKIPTRHSGRLRQTPEGKQRYAKAAKRIPIDKAALDARLREILFQNKYPMLSLREICSEKLKRDDTVVRYCSPDLAKEIAKRYLKNRHLWALQQRDSYCAVIKTTARFLQSIGVVPNHKTLKPYMNPAGRLMSDYARQAIHEVRCELGYYAEGEQLVLAV